MKSLAILLVGCLAATALCAIADGAAPDLTDSLEFVGNPSLERWPTPGVANSVLDIEVNDDRLFFAGGDWSSNSGPLFMKSYDPYSGSFTNEYVAGTEGVDMFRTFSDGGLYCVAVDHLDKGPYENGYWFRRVKGGGWSAGFAEGARANFSHVYDLMEFGEWMMLCPGAVVGSRDGGKTWKMFEGPDAKRQFDSLLRCGDELFCVESYSIDFGTGTDPAATPKSDPYTRHGPTVWRWNPASESFTGTLHPTWNDLAPGIVLGDCNLVSTIESQVSRPGRFWHTTPFKDRCLYVIGDEYSDRTYVVNGKSVTCKPVGTRPEIAVSAYARDGALKGDRIWLPPKTWPIDFTVVGDTAYMLAFSYVSETQVVRHGVWKSTDGVDFEEILTVDYPQVMQSFDYHMGYFYFGVAHQNAEPNLGPIKSGTKESAGDVYRVYCPQEPVAAVASMPTLPVAEGGSAAVSYVLSARPETNVTLSVRLLGDSGLALSAAQLVFTPSDWDVPHGLKVTYPTNDACDPESVTLVCGVGTPASPRGRFDSREVTASLVKIALADDDRAPTVADESFVHAAIPFTYAATLSDLGFLDGQAAGSATVTLTAYDDAACTHAVDSDAKTLTKAGAVSLTLTNLVRGAWYTFVAERRSSDAVLARTTAFLRAPIGTAAQLTDLTDDLANRAGTYGTNSAIGPAGNSGAWDNDLTKYFGGYKAPREAIYEFRNPTVVNGFGLHGMCKATDEQDRHPSGYSLYGANDPNGDWTLLAQVTNDPIWCPTGEWRRVPAPNATAYTCYKLTLDAPQMPNMSRIAAAEVELYHIDDSLPPDNPPEEQPEDPPDEPDDPPDDPPDNPPDDPDPPIAPNGLKVAYWSMDGVKTMNQAAADERTACWAEQCVDIIALQGLKNAALRFVSNGYVLVVTNETNGSSDGGGRQFAWKSDKFTQVGCGGTKGKPTTNSTMDWVVLEDNATHEQYVVGSGFMYASSSLTKYMKGVAEVLDAMTNACPAAHVFYCGDFSNMAGFTDLVSIENALAKFAEKGLYPLVAGDDYQWILTTDPALKGAVSSFANASFSTKTGHVVTFAGEEGPVVEVPDPAFAGEGAAAPHFDSDGRFVVTVANAVKGARYQVYATESLDVDFAPVGDVVTAGEDGALAFAVPVGTSPSMFIKIVPVD